MEFRFDLTYGSTTTLSEREQPNGFQSINSVIRRDFDASGAFYRLTESDITLDFPGGGKTIFETARDTDGIDAIVGLEIFERNDEFSAWESIYTGQADMENIVIDQDYAKVDFNEISILKKITDRLPVQVDLTQTTDLDGNAISAATTTSIGVRGRPIERQTEIEMAIYSTGTFGVGINDGLFDQDLPGFSDQSEYRFEPITDQNFWVINESTGFVRGDMNIDIYGTELTIGSALNIEYEGKNYPGTIVVAGQCSVQEISPTTLAGTIDVYLRESNIITNTINDTLIKSLSMAGVGVIPVAFDLGATINVTINSSRRYSVVYVANLSSGDGLLRPSITGLDGRQVRLTMTLQTKVENQSTPCYFIHEALRHNLAVITGDENVLDSEFFGRTQDGYLSEGIGAEFVEVNGAAVRQLTRNQFGNFRSRLESLISIFNVGWGVEQVYGNEFKVRIEPREHFYQDVLLKEITNIELESYSEEFYEWFNYNSFEAGYTKFVEDDNFKGTIQDFNTRSTWSSPVGNYSGNNKNLLSNYIASDILFELTRRQAIALKPDTSYKYDDDLFILNVNDNAAPGTYIQGSKEDIQIVNIDYDGDPDINFVINPRFNIFNLKNVLNSQLFTKATTVPYRNTNYRISPTEKIFYASGTPDLGDTTIYTAGTAPELADNIESGTTKLFDPILIRCKASISAAEEKEIREAHQNSLTNGKNYGYFRVTKPDGTTIDGWLIEMSWNIVDKIATFQLIKRA